MNMIATNEREGTHNDALHLSRAMFDRFARYITGELGIKMPPSKVTLLQSRLLRRLRELGLESLEEYGEYFFRSANTPHERVHLINAVTTNRTDFFREPQHFDYLTNTVLPLLTAAGRGVSPGGRLKVWSAGCSSGEEPYTLAMVLSEYAAQQASVDFAILATDVSTRVLERARGGIYEESQTAVVPETMRRQYLRKSSQASSPGLVRVNAALRQKICFHVLNFMEQNYRVSDLFDVIFCRNVLIYFDRPTQEEVIVRLCRNLADGGYLFVSHSESLAGMKIPVTQVRPSIFRKQSRV